MKAVKEMEFSVLISVYAKENAEYFKLAIESILNQTRMPNQVVIVKDGPLTTILDELIEGYEKKFPHLFSIVPLKENQGLGIALQRGIEECKYEYIARMDGDDIAIPQRFEKQLAMFEANPKLDIAGSYIAEFDGDISNVQSYRKVPLKHGEISKFAKRRNPFNHMTVMYKKSAVLKAGNYQPYALTEDYYLWVRMMMSGAICANSKESLVYARTGIDMFGRRGGWKYAKVEFKLQRLFLKIGFINYGEFIRNCLIRGITRVIPNSFRKFVYLKLIRK
ncbi:MAG: glycosyltransferase [Turicibacter sp.]|nr:glycosyltransferase [Turicibacter sp.]